MFLSTLQMSTVGWDKEKLQILYQIQVDLNLKTALPVTIYFYWLLQLVFHNQNRAKGIVSHDRYVCACRSVPCDLVISIKLRNVWIYYLHVHVTTNLTEAVYTYCTVSTLMSLTLPEQTYSLNLHSHFLPILMVSIKLAKYSQQKKIGSSDRRPFFLKTQNFNRKATWQTYSL